jgi:hypothetical protein
MRARRLVAMLVVCAFGVAGSATAAPDDGFMAFWTKFRTAALRGDMATLAGASRFPLQAGFDSDQDHPKAITRPQFAAFFKTELGCPGLGDGSNLDVIKRNAQLQAPFNYHNAQRAVVGSFTFQRSGGQWRLTTIAFGDPSEFADRLKGRC